MQESNQISEGMLVMLHVISKYIPSLNMSNVILICNQKKIATIKIHFKLFFSRFLQPNHCTHAIISLSRFEAALVYKLRIMSFKKVSSNTSRSAALAAAFLKKISYLFKRN